jgi:hypothetical protein
MNTMRTEKGKKMQGGQSRQFEKMAEELKLTETQKTHFTQLQAQHRSSMQTIRQNDNIDRTSKENQVKALMNEHQRNVAKLLTKDQQKQFEELKKNRPNQQNGKGRKGMGRPPVI